MENNWIKIENQKPEENKYVLLFNGYWTGVGKFNHDEYYDPSDEDCFKSPEWSDETGEYITPDPTHWQPLPAPPKPNLNTLNTQS